MQPHRDDTDLIAALSSLRPTPQPGFAAELDARAGAGFPPRPSGESPTSEQSPNPPVRGRVASWLQGKRPRLTSSRVLAPAGACALLAIVVATAVVSLNESDRNASPDGLALNEAGRAPSSGSGPTPSYHDGSGPLLSAPVRDASAAAEQPASEANATSAGAKGTAYNEAQTGGPAYDARLEKPEKSGPYAARTGRRDIERSAQIVLATDAGGVREAAGEVFAVVHSYNGIVLESAVNDGGGDAQASFELLIPSAKVGDALADFSEIAEVRSREEATADITAPTVSLEERVRDGRARIESLLGQLAEAGSDAERVAAEAELRGERARVAILRSRLSSLERRASFSRVSLQIESGAVASDDGQWGMGDALRDAGDILATAGAVTLIGLAFLAPFALLCALAWLARRVWVRRSRERSLD